jgi:hypothetical protein
MSKEINVLALVKGEQRYIFLFDDANRNETLRVLGQFAAEPELNFSWRDAAVLGQKVRDAAEFEALPQHSADASRLSPENLDFRR